MVEVVESYCLLKTLFLAPYYILRIICRLFLSIVLLTAAPAIVMMLFHTFGAFRIMILLSLWGILMHQISIGPHCVVIHLTLLVMCLITISLKSFRFLLILEGIL